MLVSFKSRIVSPSLLIFVCFFFNGVAFLKSPSCCCIERLSRWLFLVVAS